MHRPLAVIAAALLAVSFAGAGGSVAAEPTAADVSGLSPDAEQVAVIVGFHDSPDPDVVRSYGGEINRVYTLIPAVAADVPEDLLESLESHGSVEYVERDREVQWIDQTVPWGIDRVNATDVHSSDANRGSAGTDVAVVDTGIDYNHEDLNESYAGGYDFANDDSDPMDDNGHGTHVSGTVAAVDNDVGVVGVAPEADLYGVKVLNEDGGGTFSDVIAGIEWAVKGPDGEYNTADDAEVISMSLGTDSDNQSLQDAVDAAYENGSLLVAAAGNAGTTGEVVSGCAVEYPGAYQSVMAISAINKNNELAYFSCTGPEVELTAPGVDVNSTELDDSYGKKSGTSMSTPHVSGLAALIYHSIIASGYDNDSDGQWDNTEVRQRLRDTAIDLGSDGKDDSFGYGLINATAAVGVQARPTAGTGALDGDDDGTRLTHLHGDGDPGDGTRDGVVHLTSHNDSTLDYALTVADISTQDHTLDGITQLEFEYFEGENNTDAAPDEVWLVIENDTGRHIVYRTFNDGSITAPTEWRTQDVVPAIEDSDRPWVEVSTPEPNPDPRHALDSLSEDNLTEVGGNLTEVYGGGASVLAVGVGHGAPLSGPTTVDLYVDNLTVNSRGHDFPIAHVTVEPDPLNKSEGGVVNATIDLEGEWGGRTVHDINPNTVALAGVIAESDSARYPDPDDDGQDELRLEFNRTAVNDALSTGEDVPVTVDGVFVQGTVAFAATDHITVKD